MTSLSGSISSGPGFNPLIAEVEDPDPDKIVVQSGSGPNKYWT
jgi:hypothetical protein